MDGCELALLGLWLTVSTDGTLKDFWAVSKLTHTVAKQTTQI